MKIVKKKKMEATSSTPQGAPSLDAGHKGINKQKMNSKKFSWDMEHRCFEGAVRTGWRNQMGHTGFGAGDGVVLCLEIGNDGIVFQGDVGISSAPSPPVISSGGVILSRVDNAGAPIRRGC